MSRQKTTKASVSETAKRRPVGRRVPSASVGQAYEAGIGKLLRMLRRRLPVSADCEDALHDAVVKVLAQDAIERIVDLDAYLYVTVRNVGNDRYRELQREPAESVDHGELEESLELPAQHLRSVEENCMINDMLGKILERLPPEEREAVRLVKAERLTYRQAAAAMKISERRIETLLARAKARALELDPRALDHISGERK